MTEQGKTRIPAPLYAAAGAGELAYEQLRKLPARVQELREKANASGADLRHKAVATRDDLRHKAVATRDDLRHKAVATRDDLRQKATARLKEANETASELRDKANKATGELDLEHLREVARRNANTVLAEAKAARVRAIEMYHELVARGERIVGSGVVEVADTVNADMEATEATELPAAESAAKARTETVKAPVAKRTRPAATRK